jgi:predicted MFS family arabinose efflux permease
VVGPRQGRYVSFYTSSFTIGTSASFLVSGLVASRAGWRWAFAAAALAQLIAAVIVFHWIPRTSGTLGTSGTSGTSGTLGTSGIPFLSVFRAREAMDYILGYAAHMWELFAMRTWLVPFLAYSLSRQNGRASGATAAAAASLVTLVGVPASIGGQELASRLGPRRHIIRTMIVSAALAALVGWCAPLPFALVVLLCSIYSVTISCDSAPLTAAALAAAPSGLRGATMAVHSTLGFAVAFAGSLAVGALLDALGGDNATAWGLAFAAMGLSNVFGVWRLGKAGPTRVDSQAS